MSGTLIYEAGQPYLQGKLLAYLRKSQLKVEHKGYTCAVSGSIRNERQSFPRANEDELFSACCNVIVGHAEVVQLSLKKLRRKQAGHYAYWTTSILT